MSKVILYHNPSCSKSREAVAALKSEGVDLEVIEYLKSPLSEQEVRRPQRPCLHGAVTSFYDAST
jgi:arsenate reductase